MNGDDTPTVFYVPLVPVLNSLVLVFTVQVLSVSVFKRLGYQSSLFYTLSNGGNHTGCIIYKYIYIYMFLTPIVNSGSYSDYLSVHRDIEGNIP